MALQSGTTSVLSQEEVGSLWASPCPLFEGLAQHTQSFWDEDVGEPGQQSQVS